MSLALAGGLGPVLNVFGELYAPDGYGRSDIALLLTLPSLFIGLGKLSSAHSLTPVAKTMVTYIDRQLYNPPWSTGVRSATSLPDLFRCLAIRNHRFGRFELIRRSPIYARRAGLGNGGFRVPPPPHDYRGDISPRAGPDLRFILDNSNYNRRGAEPGEQLRG